MRFLGLVLGGWTAMRVAVLWPTAVPAGPTLPVLAAATPRAVQPGQVQAAAIMASVPTAQRSPHIEQRSSVSLPEVREADPIEKLALMSPLARPETSVATSQRPSSELAVTPQPPASLRPQRLAGSAWLVVRQGGSESLAFGQLGASQAGVRLTYALDRRVALSGRLSTPLRGAGREVAFGLDWQPTHLPVHLLAEQRLDIETGRTRPAAEIIVGTAVSLPLRVSLDAYGQAGAVARRGGFIDGAARLSRIAADLGPARVEVGGGAWGGAQRGATRLDVGPSLAVVFPAEGGGARLSLDYRLRVAGRASPGSGPALTLGSRF